MSYTKLFGSILDSTIWQEDLHVKVVWITMLAMADRDGVVEASVPGLARRATVTIQQAEHALERLLAPDPYSRTKEHEGRRIAPLDIGGGWRLLNYEKYREKLDADDQRAKAAARQQRKRDREKVERNRDGHATVTAGRDEITRECDDVTHRHAESRLVRQAEAEAEAEDLSLSGSSSSSPELPDPRAVVGADHGAPPPADAPPPWMETDLPEGWRPDAEPDLDRSAAEVGVDADAELRKLHDRARARGTTSVDWQASWRTWLQRAIDWARKSAPPNDAERARRQRAAVSAQVERDREAIRMRDEAAARDRSAVAEIASKALADLGGSP